MIQRALIDLCDKKISYQKMVPLVSIIIPAYNRAHVISGALNSLLRQQYPHTEIIVVDDGSRDTDALVGVIRDFRQRFAGELILVHQKNTGPGGARAHGLRLSKGHYIQYLDSDDVLLPGAIKRHVAALEAHPNAAMAYGITLDEQPDGNRVERMFARDYVPDLLEATLQWRRWNTSNPLWHYPGDNWRARKWWSDSAANEDFVHDVRVACINQRMLFIPEPAMLYRILTSDRQSTKRGRSITKARFLSMMEVRQTIQDAGLMHQPRYALFFAERCLFEAVQAGRYRCWKESIQFADWALAHFPGSVLKTQALAAAVATRAFHHFGISPRITTPLLKRLFKMHKRLHPVSLHLDRVP